jgi:allophanate hydrolase
MTLHVINAGVQTSIQGGPRVGLRHWALPSGGAADLLSLALANRLVGNEIDHAGLEISLSGASFDCDDRLVVAVTGADALIAVNGSQARMHETLRLDPGDRLEIGAARTGARSYLAIAGNFSVPVVLGSRSTCMAAKFGGFDGRPLKNGDIVPVRVTEPREDLRTPAAYRLTPPVSPVLRAVPVPGVDCDALFDVRLKVGGRADRMGVQLAALPLRAAGDLGSQPVFPGGIQLPPEGHPFLLGVDAQTTGGYALLANVARVDRHCIGQLRPGSSLSFARREPELARDEFLQKLAYFRPWLANVDAAIR